MAVANMVDPTVDPVFPVLYLSFHLNMHPDISLVSSIMIMMYERL